MDLRIDLQNDPEIAAGRDLVEHLVGAHMVAHDEEELLHMVGVSISEINQSDTEHSLRVLVHAVYRSQSLIVKLLDLATRQSLRQESNQEMTESGERFREQRLQLWSETRDEAV
jgi:hypothetical protein